MSSLFTSLAASQCLKRKELTSNGYSLESVKTADLAALVKQLSYFDINDRLIVDYNCMSGEQLECMFDNIAQSSNLQLHTLKIRTNLSTIKCDTLAKVVCRLHTANLRETYLTTKQLTKLFQLIIDTTDLKLQVLNLRYVLLNEVSDELFANAVCKLHTVDLSCTKISSDQLTRLCQMIISSTHSKLKNLTLSKDRLTGVRTELIQEIRNMIKVTTC